MLHYPPNAKERYNDYATSKAYWAKIDMQTKSYGPNEQMFTHLQFFNSIMLKIMTTFGLDAVEPKMFKRLVSITRMKSLEGIPDSFINLQEIIFVGIFTEFIPGTTSNKEYNTYRDSVVYDFCKVFRLVFQ